VAFVRTNVSVDHITTIIRIGTMSEAAYVLPKRRFLHEPHGFTFQKTAFFTVTVVETSNLT
jgi:hypothetical protein